MSNNKQVAEGDGLVLLSLLALLSFIRLIYFI